MERDITFEQKLQKQRVNKSNESNESNESTMELAKELANLGEAREAEAEAN
jgi:hypothetical protein